MNKVFVVGLVGMELAMVGTALPARFSPGMLIQPPMVDAKWAREMARRAELDARRDAERIGHRPAVEACIGPSGPSLSPSRYEAKEAACEARLAGRVSRAKAEPSEDTAPRYEYNRPPQDLQIPRYAPPAEPATEAQPGAAEAAGLEGPFDPRGADGA